jgi:hypothetical protein
MRNDIISELYQSKEVNELISKIRPIELQDDLKQYAFAVLLEKPEAFIIDLHNKKQLRYFLVKIITNSVFTNRSGFMTLHKLTKDLDVDCISDVENESSNYHDLLDSCNTEIKNVYWYNAELLNLYAQHGSYRKVSEVTNIPVKSVYNAIKKAKETIKQKIWK